MKPFLRWLDRNWFKIAIILWLFLLLNTIQSGTGDGIDLNLRHGGESNPFDIGGDSIPISLDVSGSLINY